MTYIDLLNHNDYEILNEYPFSIRKKANNKIIGESLNGCGYARIHLNGCPYYKHRLIALQFIPNPDPALLTEIDHINRDRADNHILNLQWVSYSINDKNRSSNKNIDCIFIGYSSAPEDLIIVDRYGNNEIEDLYYSPENNKFYFDGGVALKELYVNCDKRSGSYFVNSINIDGKQIKIYLAKFKRDRGF